MFLIKLWCVLSDLGIEVRRIRLILIIGLGAIIFLQFLQLVLTSTSEVRTIKNLWNDDAQIEIIRNSSSLPLTLCSSNLIYLLFTLPTPPYTTTYYLLTLYCNLFSMISFLPSSHLCGSDLVLWYFNVYRVSKNKQYISFFDVYIDN